MYKYLVIYLVSITVLSLIIVGIAKKINDKQNKYVPCDTCKYLFQKGGGTWNYYCSFGCISLKKDSCNHFDFPPEICGNYDPRITMEE